MWRLGISSAGKHRVCHVGRWTSARERHCSRQGVESTWGGACGYTGHVGHVHLAPALFLSRMSSLIFSAATSTSIIWPTPIFHCCSRASNSPLRAACTSLLALSMSSSSIFLCETSRSAARRIASSWSLEINHAFLPYVSRSDRLT